MTNNYTFSLLASSMCQPQSATARGRHSEAGSRDRGILMSCCFLQEAWSDGNTRLSHWAAISLNPLKSSSGKPNGIPSSALGLSSFPPAVSSLPMAACFR